MPIDFRKTIGSNDSLAFMSKGSSKIFRNKISVSAFLTFMVIVLIMMLYPTKKGTPVWVLLRLGFYIFLVSLTVLFLHDCVLTNDIKAIYSSDKDDEIINVMNRKSNPVYDNEKTDVEPKLSYGGEHNGDGDDNGDGVNGGDYDGAGAEALFQQFGV
jgi:hypothetical protein